MRLHSHILRSPLDPDDGGGYIDDDSLAAAADDGYTSAGDDRPVTVATDPAGAIYAGAEKPYAEPPRSSGMARWTLPALLARTVHGKFFSIDFFRRHWAAVLGIVIMLMIYITSRYSCQTQMETIQRLERELEVAKTERIREKSAYMSRIRESMMQQKVDSLGLGLTVQEQPPYRIEMSN